MNNGKAYTGIDVFRIAAALLIIAIHTSPLSSYSETGDFILTRITGRIAVPFFFMVSGFFLISGYSRNYGKLKAFIKNTALIYGIAIAGYIPLNIYNGYFAMDNLLPNIIKDIVFDGTMYHLWYLPAAITGAAAAWLLTERLGLRKAFVIAALLYAIGLFGDSYYGIAEKLPVAEKIYACIFEISDYTRNGIFFAPVFFVLGGIIAGKAIRISLKGCIIGFAASFSLMLIEGMALHGIGIQRHDSMYIMLLPCLYFLFSALTFWRGPRLLLLKTSAMIIYIIHPMVIVVVRLLAKILGLQVLLIENSIIHYLAVSAVTISVSMLASLLYRKVKKKKPAFHKSMDRAWLELDMNNLKHNVEALSKAMPHDCELMAVVKAGAYGHGLFEVSSYVNRLGVKVFAVATIEEGIELRRFGIVGEILILGYTDPERAKELCKYNLTQTLIDFNYAVCLNSQGFNVKAHIKIDTGMHRLGFDVYETAHILEVFSLDKLKIYGIYTHLCSSDSLSEDAADFTRRQIEKFYELLELLKNNGAELPKIHIQSTYGLLNYPELKCNYIRAGVSLYGVLSTPNSETRLQLDLRPVLSLKSKIILIRKIKSGESMGYGRAFTANRDSLLAILPVGYADGFPRNLSCGNGEVIIRGCRAPTAGRICMDQLAVDITDIPGAAVGDIATLIGKDGQEELSAPEAADNSATITNELLSRMGARLKIVERQ
ncbi:serine/alanine racemase [Ruminiclostridium sufflavum DSM 19573]|uniref:Alanine racemase n=1 Tax=Ruminiclostridium sufflavum DSM 19573 TaxID=1121337 RepID=A0A318XKJ9_9FIRM|nr:serine racemase VanT catalytic subunit [Ruminiclostridium sufflavum]PYG87624.1 serine/alanine racemase [Ruminiclostridium sufflavum DSM 19573]